jgi:Ca2+-binding EF-hand superfamily protein
MIAEVDTTGKGVINFRDFLEMMLGKGFALSLHVAK